MIYRRALIQEIMLTMLAVFIALASIAAVTQWVRFLSQAASGILAPEAVLAFLGFGMISSLPILLTVTLFLSVLLTLSRMSRDHEMVVWQTAGLGQLSWVRPVMQVAIPMFFLIIFITLFLSPWSLRKSTEYRQQLESREDISSLAPGVFKESNHNERVFFVESLGTSNATVKNVFVRSEQHSRLGIMVAKQGTQFVQPNGDRFLVLESGRRYEGSPGQADYRMMQFQRYTIRVEPFEVKLGEPSTKSLATGDLFEKPTLVKRAEIHWRLSLPVSAMLLVLLAIPLSYFNPRSGRSFHLIAALLVYVVYNNLLSIAHASVLNGKLAPWAGVWSVHILMLFVITMLYSKRQSMQSLLFWRRK